MDRGAPASTFRLESRQDEDQVVVEVWELVQLLEFLPGR